MRSSARPQTSDLLSGELPPLSIPVLMALVAAKIALHIPGLFRYGYFRDELYFLDCAHHLDWGYVDPHRWWPSTPRSPSSLVVLFPLCAFVADACRGRADHDDGGTWPASSGGGVSALQAIAGMAIPDRTGSPHDRQHPLHELLRAHLLDGLRVGRDPHRSHRRFKAVARLRRPRRARAREQTLHPLLRRRRRRRRHRDASPPRTRETPGSGSAPRSRWPSSCPTFCGSGSTAFPPWRTCGTSGRSARTSSSLPGRS